MQSSAVLRTLFAGYHAAGERRGANVLAYGWQSALLANPGPDTSTQPYDSQQSEDNEQFIRDLSPASLDDLEILDPSEIPSPQHDTATIYVTGESNSTAATLQIS